MKDTLIGESYEDVMEAISQNPLVNVPYEFPIYSNTGINLLGLSNIAANKLFSNTSATEPQTHKELVKRDIFEPLGFKSSFYQVPPTGSPLRKHIAVASKDSEWVDVWFGDVNDPSGGQYSSLSDLSILMKTLLSPTARGGVIPASAVREWLRPLHVWGNSQQQVGAPWEITSLGDFRAYTKGIHHVITILLKDIDNSTYTQAEICQVTTPNLQLFLSCPSVLSCL